MLRLLAMEGFEMFDFSEIISSDIISWEITSSDPETRWLPSFLNFLYRGYDADVTLVVTVTADKLWLVSLVSVVDEELELLDEELELLDEELDLLDDVLEVLEV
jgi:hypothetical protein